MLSRALLPPTPAQSTDPSSIFFSFLPSLTAEPLAVCRPTFGSCTDDVVAPGSALTAPFGSFGPIKVDWLKGTGGLTYADNIVCNFPLTTSYLLRLLRGSSDLPLELAPASDSHSSTPTMLPSVILLTSSMVRRKPTPKSEPALLERLLRLLLRPLAHLLWSPGSPTRMALLEEGL